ncbi:MAG: WG repeat-containing protein, partial [Lewinella sp.]|nr:WG repeat-containing protein [Lewinella sp.]
SWCGQEVLPAQYQEIQSQGEAHFRVNQDGKWGVVNIQDQVVIPLIYDYIAPLQGPVCTVKQNGRFGLLNDQGDMLANPEFDRIEVSDREARAYRLDSLSGQEELTLIRFDEQGQLIDNSAFQQHFQIKVAGAQPRGGASGAHRPSDYQLERFEWFYSPRNDRWGLRDLQSGNVVIEPLFDYIQVEKDLGLTLVGIWKSADYEFERTTFRFDMAFGLVQNETGLLVTDIDFLDVRFDDFRQGLPLARCVFADGKHGLVDGIGRIVRRDLAFIGEYAHGLARVSLRGRLSGARDPQHSLGALTSYLDELLAPSSMVDYTSYDQLFRKEAQLTCEDCEWGYLDTCGQVVINPTFTFAQDMVNDAGIVACGDKWGMVHRDGQMLIPCQYDGIAFLENTGNRMVRVYIERPQYGLIDTLGQLTVSAIYEELGHFAEGRLAVRRNGLWGFVDVNGLEVIPCRFREVSDFSEGLAAVKLGNYWGFIDKQGDWVIENQYRRVGNFQGGLAWADSPGGFGYINPDNQWLIQPAFSKAFDFQAGVARVVSDGAYGLINQDGSFLVRPRFIDIGPFNEQGLAIASFGRDRVRYGLLDREGELITTDDFRSIGPFREGRAVVKDRQGYGFIDTTGQIVIPTIYSKAGDFHEGRAVVQQNGKCGFVDADGELIVPCAYSRCQDFSGGRAVVYQGIKNAGIIDRDGRLIVEPSLDRLLEFQEGRGLMRDEAYRFYYITEQTSLYDGYYESATPFQHGVAVVRINGKWGIINQRGIEIIPPKYDHIESFEDGYAKVRIEGFNGLSNLNGELLVQPHYELITYAGDGLFRVEQGDKVGYFDTEGRWVWDLSR